MSHATKKWEVFPGRNKFCWDGKIIMGPDVTVFYINVFLIVGTTLLFVIFDVPYLTKEASPFIPIVTVILFIFVMSTLLKTSFTDPGIIPRATADEATYTEKQIKITACGDVSAERPPPRTKEVFIHGQSIKLKYCFTCKIFRPPRASHCSLCDNCVDHFDHHCPWVGNCVGRRNYRYFYLFTVTLSIYIAFVFVCTCIHLYLLSKDQQVVEAVAESPASVIVLLITFFSCWSVFGLAGFHTYLAASNQTTNEDIKGAFSNKRGGTNRNPYTSGNGCLNCCYVLCGPFSPSLIDRQGFISPELTEKKVIAERTPSKIGTPVFASNIANVHYPLNGLKAYPSLNQGHKLQSAVITAHQQQLQLHPLGRQNFVQKSSPSLSEGLYCDFRRYNVSSSSSSSLGAHTVLAPRNRLMAGRHGFGRNTVPYLKNAATQHRFSLPVKLHYPDYTFDVPEKSVTAFQEGVQCVTFNSVSLLHTTVVPMHVPSANRNSRASRIVPGDLI